MTNKKYRLLGSNGLNNLSETPGTIGGNSKLKIYGRLDCPSALRYLEKGQYAKHRIFFANESDAISNGYRPCGICMRRKYKMWKAGGKPGSIDFPWLILPLMKVANETNGLKMTREEIIQTIRVIDNVGMTDDFTLECLSDKELMQLFDKVCEYSKNRSNAFKAIDKY